MTAGTDTGLARVFERWHETVVARDLEGLMALYDKDAVLESPLILMALKDKSDGILKGKAAIRSFFAAAFRDARNGLGRWYRTGSFFSDGRRLIWEYPRETPEGDQIDLMEVMEIEDGLIIQHRVYWGWVGVAALAALKVPRRAVS